jgi:hypothetical protein
MRSSYINLTFCARGALKEQAKGLDIRFTRLGLVAATTVMTGSGGRFGTRCTARLRAQLATLRLMTRGLGPVAAWREQAFEEFSVCALDGASESAGGKCRLIDDLAAHDPQ